MLRLKLRDEGRIRRERLPSLRGSLTFSYRELHPSRRRMSKFLPFEQLLDVVDPGALIMYYTEELQFQMHGALMPSPAVQARVGVDPCRSDGLTLEIRDAHYIHHCEACVGKPIDPRSCNCIQQARIELEVLYGKQN